MNYIYIWTNKCIPCNSYVFHSCSVESNRQESVMHMKHIYQKSWAQRACKGLLCWMYSTFGALENPITSHHIHTHVCLLWFSPFIYSIYAHKTVNFLKNEHFLARNFNCCNVYYTEEPGYEMYIIFSSNTFLIFLVFDYLFADWSEAHVIDVLCSMHTEQFLI